MVSHVPSYRFSSVSSSSLEFDRKADILIGGMDNDARVQKILWISIPYIQDDQTWCVATARPQDLWQNIFSIYTVGTWLMLIAAIYFNALIIYLLIPLEDKNESYVWTLMIGMASALGQYATYEPHRISIRVMMVFLFMYGIVMSSSFNSFLISILTRPRFKQQIDSLDLAIKHDFQFAGGEVALSHYLGHDEVSIYLMHMSMQLFPFLSFFLVFLFHCEFRRFQRECAKTLRFVLTPTRA